MDREHAEDIEKKAFAQFKKGKSYSPMRLVLSIPPSLPIQIPVLDCLCQMSRLDVFGGIEVGDGPGYFQNPVIRPGREDQLFHGVFE